MKKSISLIEIIISIVIISIILQLAYTKFFNVVDKTNLIKIRAQVSKINEAINTVYSNQILLGNSNFILKKLDDVTPNQSNQMLFTGYDEYVLLDDIIYSTTKESKKIGNFIKESDINYKIYITNEEYINFIYDVNEQKFYCNTQEDLCKELDL